ncbi:MAG TPA: lysophospholipid acyltransferase family protein [Tepidisphaeraceae bacterium]|nr:lysophospholipid acyltransferase family protein [Tepidisphaeraceae bacterium]
MPPGLAARAPRADSGVAAPLSRSSLFDSAGDGKKPSGAARRGWNALLRWVNKTSADFWLNFFFWHARRQPWFAAATKPFFLFFAWRYSEHLYGGTMANARRILGESSTHAQREKLARRMIDNFYDFVCDVGLSLGQTPRQMVRRIVGVEGADIYTDARKAGKGAIVLTAHMGSFEVGAAALVEREKRMHVLFRRDSLDLFEQIRSTLRRKIGVNEVPVDQGWTLWMRLRDALANDEVVLIQGDRVMPGQKGQAVRFFDGHILLPAGPAKLALVSGAPIIPVFSIRTPRGEIQMFIETPIWVGEVPGGLSIDSAMDAIGAVLEKYVRRFPDQWLENRPAWIEDAGKPMPKPPMKSRRC